MQRTDMPKRRLITSIVVAAPVPALISVGTRALDSSRDTLPAMDGPSSMKRANGVADGVANGVANGIANGHANGYANGHANGHANGQANGELKKQRLEQPKYHREPSSWDKPTPTIKAYKNPDFLNSSHARSMRMMCEYEETMQRLCVRWCRPLDSTCMPVHRQKPL